MKHQHIWVCAVASLSLMACAPKDDASETKATPKTQASKTAGGESLTSPVEITLIDVLDGVTSSYCIDIAGGNKDIDITKGLQAHTCYSYRGEVGTDQKFDPSRFARNELYMPDYDVCAAAESLSAGSKIGLASCDGSDQQQISFSERGTLSMVAAPELCLTAGVESRFGRSKVHQIKALSLESCADDLAAYQQWKGRSSAD